MGNLDLREWIAKLESESELLRIKAKVDWNGEISGIIRKTFAERGPAILFENIKDYEKTVSTRLFVGGLGNQGRVNMMLGLPKGTPHSEAIQTVRERLKKMVKPVVVKAGPVKENIVKGNKIDLFQFPVPQWHALDGGRYINTFCGIVTRDPDTGELNVGLYRGMIVDKNRISVLLVPAQGWGVHYTKYKERGQAMPVAVIYGWNPVLPFVASAPLSSEPEYEAMGALLQQPVELVKCETSDLEVPASAEIVVEGTISPDSDTFEWEGPFGEWTGRYGQRSRRPVIKVDCITHRNNPIFRGALEGQGPGVITESGIMDYIVFSAIMWNTLESQGITGVLDVAPEPWGIVKIHKTYEGQAKRIAAALWGSQMTLNYFKIIVVVEEEVDIHNPRALQVVMRNNVDPKEDIVVFPGCPGSNLDPSMPADYRDELKYGIGIPNKWLIDATINWKTHPIREEYGNRRLPPLCTDYPKEIEDLVTRRWQEYGFAPARKRK